MIAGRRTTRTLGLGLLAWALSLGFSSPAAAQDELRVLFLTPTAGALGQISEEMAKDLTSRGVRVDFAREAELPEDPPDTLVVHNGLLPADGLPEALLRFMELGGGIVLLVEPSADHYREANLLLGRLGVEMSELPRSPGDLRLEDSPLTRGLQLPPRQGLRVRLQGPGLLPVIFAERHVAAAQILHGEGGLLVLPSAVIYSGLRQRPPERAGLTLAVRACSWAARPLRELPPEPVDGFGPSAPVPLATTLPLESTDFSGAILYDSMAADDAWPEVNGVLQSLLADVGLPLLALRVDGSSSPLARALESEPPLVMVGSWREFTELEALAFYYYLQGGGRALVAARALSRTQRRLIFLNELLYPCGLLVALGRREGAARVESSPLAGRLPDIPQLRGGSVWVRGPAAEPVLTVDGRAALALARSGPGRLVVFDARPLLETPVYREVLREAIRWLITTDT